MPLSVEQATEPYIRAGRFSPGLWPQTSGGLASLPAKQKSREACARADSICHNRTTGSGDDHVAQRLPHSYRFNQIGARHVRVLE